MPASSPAEPIPSTPIPGSAPSFPAAPLPLDDDGLWQTILDRDPAWDGRVYFAVRTTGVYCRPSCPARRPRRANVLFVPSPDAAERLGFRPCRRCAPREVDAQAAFVAAACAFIDAHLDEPLTLARIGEAVGVSPAHLQRTFTRLVGVSPRAYAAARRLDRVKSALAKGAPVTVAIYDAGFGSGSRLYERTGAELGMTPGAYRDGGAGASITYAIADSPFGRLLVATTARGICAVSLGDSDQQLEARLASEFASADRHRDDAAAQAWIQAVVDHLRGNPAHARLDLPLDIRATGFQRRVWAALRAIPPGETRTYGEIARQLGDPAAARAVAGACAANPVALVIPCHRVVRSDGAPGGYRWGAARKERLLERERNTSIPTG